MKKLTILFIISCICSMLNSITFLIEGNIPAFVGWFVSSCALVLLHMIFGGWQKLKAGYEAEIAKYKQDLDESQEREKIACKAVAEKREEITRLTRWHDPKEELPEYIKIVEIKYEAFGKIMMAVAFRLGDLWSSKNKWCIDGTRACIDHENVIGWREVHE